MNSDQSALHKIKIDWVITRAGNLPICSSLIRSFCSNQISDCERFAQIAKDKWVTVSESLRSLKTNEQLWVNRTDRSRQMSDRERFAQTAHDKWVNEQFAQKNLPKNLKSYFSVCFIYFFLNLKYEWFAHSLFLVSDVSESLRPLTKNERCEPIVQFAHQKWVTMSDSLRSLTKNEWPWANCSGRSPKMSESLVFFERIANLLICLQKTIDSLREPMSKIPYFFVLKILN